MTPEEFTERSLLGVLVREPQRIREVGPHLAGADFANDRHATVFDIMRQHEVSLTHLANAARADGRYQSEQWATVLANGLPEFARYGIGPAYLAEVIAAAPASGGQPAVYAELVMEASIRRQITELGYEAARLSAQTPPVAELLAAQEKITTQLAAAQQRWDAITQTRDVRRTLTGEAAASDGGDRDLFGRPVLPMPTTPAPSAEEVHAAQEQVIGGILRHPGVADALLGRLESTDFLDQELGNTLDAAQQVHAHAAVTGRQVDPVTVAWALQTLPEHRGPTPPPEYLHDLAATAEPNERDHAVDLVMRSSLAKLTTTAANTTQQAASHAGMAPADVLATARTAYQSVDTAARRLTGNTATDYQLGVLDNRATPNGAPTTAELAGLRSRSTALLQQTTAAPAEPSTAPYSGIGARLNAVESSPIELEAHSDAGPGPA